MLEEYSGELATFSLLSIILIIALIRQMIKLKLQLGRIESQRDNDILEARKDSNKKQRATIKGQISETLAP